VKLCRDVETLLNSGLQVGLSPAHGLMGVAGEDGRLECFDPRQRAAVGVLDAAAVAGAVSHLHQLSCWTTEMPYY
jgi:hypothetical protein